MSNIQITAEAAAALRSASAKDKEYVSTETPLPNGMMSVPVEDDTLESLLASQMDSEKLSDTIIRLAAHFHSGGKAN